MTRQLKKWRLIATLCFAALFCPHSDAEALNTTSEALLKPLFAEGRKARSEELTTLLLPIAAEEKMSNNTKMREMSYIAYSAGWHLSKSEKRTFFDSVFRKLDQNRKEKYLLDHAKLDEKHRSAIQSGEVIVGMSKAGVIASLGKAEEVRPARGTFLNTERWSYFSKQLILYFKNEHLTSLKPLS